ncbi:glycosyltransferase family 2 protein [Falsiroseomonas sp. HW251]|uniref:glycosyltransferase family 2 protein n=1 Tax=Falsiroseomonas sp. HW251 TaxID=3390998 RepID=UPI003D323604
MAAGGLGPVVVMSFNRPAYLRQTLLSIAAQASVADGSREVHLFQDGAVNFHSGTRYATDEEIEAAVATFREVFPHGTIHVAPRNIGIALNFDRAERYVFLRRRFPSAAFFEDDMVLGPHYLATLQRFLDYAASPASFGLVGYVAAYGHHRAKLAEQMARRREVMNLGHAWGYGVTREHWLKVREIIDPYIRIVSDCDYRVRPKARIGGVHKSLGMATHALSQDAMKMLATYAVGRVRLMPFVCQARYVGAEGVNFTPESWAKRGYGHEEIFPEEQAEFDWPEERSLRLALETARGQHAAHCRQVYGDRDLPVPPFGTFLAEEHA